MTGGAIHVAVTTFYVVEHAADEADARATVEAALERVADVRFIDGQRAVLVGTGPMTATVPA